MAKNLLGSLLPPLLISLNRATDGDHHLSMIDLVSSYLHRLRSYGGEALSRIVGGAGTVFAIQAVGAVLAYAMEVVAARVLGSAQYGFFAYALGWVTVLSLPATLGLHTGAVKLVPRYASRGRPDRLVGLFRSATALTVAGGLALGLPAMALVASQTTLPWAATDAATVGAACLIPLLALGRIQTGFARGLDRMAWAYAPRRIAVPTLTIAGLAAVAWIGLGNADASDVVYLFLGALLVATGTQALFVHRQIDAEREDADGATYDISRWLKLGIPLLAVSSSIVLLNRTDVLVLGALAPGETVGRYNAAAKTAKGLGLILTSVNAVGGPLISKLHAEGKHDKLESLTSILTRVAFWPSVAAAVALGLGAEIVLSMFGSEFTAGHDALIILLAGHVVNASFGPVAYLLNMTGHERAVAVVIGLAVVVNAVLCFLLIPAFGPNGAALSSALAILTWNSGLWWLARERLGIDSWVGAVFYRGTSP